MPTPFKDLELSHSQISIMKSIKRSGKILKNHVNADPNYQFLLVYSLLDHCPADCNSYVLSNKGLMFLRYHRRNNIKVIYPIVVSTISLIVSIISLVKSFM